MLRWALALCLAAQASAFIVPVLQAGPLSPARTTISAPSPAVAWAAPPGALSRDLLRVRGGRPGVAASRVAMSSSGSSTSADGASSVAAAYAVTGVLSVLSWLALSYVALSFHPVPSINAACGWRHNSLTMAHAWAFPIPVGWAVFTALHSAASVGWDRLKSATYRRLNLALAAASLWMAAAAFFCPLFSVGYDLFPKALAVTAALIHTSTGILSLGVWLKTISGNPFTRLLRGLVGSVYCLVPRAPSDDPDNFRGDVAIYSLAATGLFVLAALPQLAAFPLATIPAILGKRLSRMASAFTFLAAVATYCLKDAAERDRLNASTFVTLRRGLAYATAGHLLVLFLKVAGVDGGGLLLPGNGLWEFYPSMVAAPKAAAATAMVYGALCCACFAKLPPKADTN